MTIDIIRVWKDDIYRQDLGEQQRSQLPANPAGELELSSAELGLIYGGCGACRCPGGTFSPAPTALSQAEAVNISRKNFHSFAFFCQESVFSFNGQTGHGFLSAVNNVCVNDN